VTPNFDNALLRVSGIRTIFLFVPSSKRCSGSNVVLKMPRIDKLVVWVIVEIEGGKEVYRLSFGGGDVICR